MQWRLKSPHVVYSTFYSGADQRKLQSSASLAFVRGIHRWPVNSPHIRPVTEKMFPFDDVIMSSHLIFRSQAPDMMYGRVLLLKLRTNLWFGFRVTIYEPYKNTDSSSYWFIKIITTWIIEHAIRHLFPVFCFAVLAQVASLISPGEQLPEMSEFLTEQPEYVADNPGHFTQAP